MARRCLLTRVRHSEEPRLALRQGGVLTWAAETSRLGGTRTTYSQYCGDLASHGFVVAAVEHRDGTCPSTTVLSEGGKVARIVKYMKLEDLVWEDEEAKGRRSAMGWRREELGMRQVEVEVRAVPTSFPFRLQPRNL